ncbi:hypothetical protein BDV12DRAFT_195289 [Aspergillus spectabilis]
MSCSGPCSLDRNAPIERIAELTGPTITTVPVRLQVNMDQTVMEFLRYVQQHSTKMIPHEHAGLQRIKKLSPQHEKKTNFQNLLVIQPAQRISQSEGGSGGLWELEDMASAGLEEFLTYPIVLECRLGREQLDLTAKVDPRLVSKEEMGRMLHHFEAALEQLTRSTDIQLRNVSLVAHQDVADMLRWNGKLPERLDACIHEAIMEMAIQYPDHPAVSAADKNLTYSQLNTLTSRLAHHLTTLGVGPESLVPICFNKSAWGVVGMIAVLKAGGGYLALDPAYPAARKQLLIEKSSASVVLTTNKHADALSSLVQHVVSVDEKFLATLPMHDSFANTNVTSSNVAFIVFTSGSTGIPKGIMMEHGSFCSGARAHAAALKINKEARVMQFATYTYDVSIGEVFTTLINGGCVCQLAILTPTVASLLQPDSVPSLKYLVLGGEHATSEKLARWADKVCLINSYGPAECAVWTNCAFGISPESSPSSIGNRIGCRLWVVDRDDHHHLVPVGFVGELLVEGPGLARGYLKEPAKTQAAFIENLEWAKVPGQGSSPPRRMYKTGDLVRYNTDGTLSIVGRKDMQVKLNGQRLELGEVEHHLLMDDQIQHAMVTMPRTGRCEKRLVAIIALRDFGSTKTNNQMLQLINHQHRDSIIRHISRVRAILADRLPSFKVPTVWLTVGNLSLNLSGKLDRPQISSWVEALDEDAYNQALDVSSAASLKPEPATEMERRLQSLWARALRINPDTIGADHDFFRLGGDSISAMRLTAALRVANIKLDVATIFPYPRLNEMALAAAIEGSDSSLEEYQPLDALKEQELSLRGFLDTCTPPQHGRREDQVEDILRAADHQSWNLARGHLRTRGYNCYFIIPFFGPLDVSHLASSCSQVVQHHAVLRSVFVVRQGKLYQVVKAYNPESSNYKKDDCPRRELVASAIQDDMLRPVRLGAGSICFILTKQAPHQHSLIVRIQHAQYYGVSVPTVLEDIKQCYHGKPLSQMADFSLFLHYQRQINLTEHIKNPVNRSIIRTVQPHSLSNQGITFATLVKAAWSVVLCQLFSSTDVVFGQVTTGRNSRYERIEEISGPCVNMLPVRVTMAAGWTVGDLLHTVQDQHRSTIPHELLGFQDIVEHCTNWPRWTRFSSILQHTNLGDDDGIGQQPTADTRTTPIRLEAFSPPTDCADVWIWYAPAVEQAYYTFDFTYSDQTFTPDLAEHLANMLTESILFLSSNVGAPLSTCLLSNTCTTPFPLGGIASQGRPSVAHTRAFQNHKTQQSKTPLSSLSSWPQVQKAWHQALAHLTPDTYTPDTPFYDMMPMWKL